MKKLGLFSKVLAFVPIICLVFAAQAFAGKDDFRVSNVDEVKVADSDAAYTTSVAGESNNRTLTLTNAIVGAQAVSIKVTWAVAAGSSPRTTTYPKNGVGFTISTVNGSPVISPTITPTTCDVTISATTCTTTVSFTTPNETVNYQLLMDPTNTGTGNSALQGRNLTINFSTEMQAGKKDTTLSVADICVPYQSGAVDLTATLREALAPYDPITGRLVDFSIDSNDIGTDSTDGNGEAVLSYNVNTLSAGDHNLFVEFAGDSQYNPSDNSANLGIYYNFVGFQPPINPEGNSVFGNGRVIPIKIKIVDANLNSVANASPEVWIYQWSEGTGLGEVLEAATSVSGADTGNIMRYVPADQQYIYNWDLSSLANGTYAVVVDLGDSDACSKGPYYATITVSKKGKK
jgi:hypothetical protein